MSMLVKFNKKLNINRFKFAATCLRQMGGHGHDDHHHHPMMPPFARLAPPTTLVCLFFIFCTK